MNKTLLQEYWNKYKAEFGTDNFKKNELYKWSLFKQMYPIWKWKKGESNIEMYENTFNVDGHKNLWLSGNFFPISMFSWMLDKFPKETENAMELLFDETKNLSDRIESFTAILDNKLPELAKLITEKPINQHYHGDLRAISIYLTLQYPEKYFLYKHTMYKDFSEFLELPKVKTGKSSNYTEYLDVCNEIREFIRSDKGFMKNYEDFLSGENFYKDPYLHLLVQDFILSVSTYEPSYWIFQGNPKVYNFSSAISNGTIDQWTASAHRDKMRIGDKVIFWLTGTNSGCYALGEISSDPFQNLEPKDEFWKEEDKSEWKVGVKISHNCSSNPILKEHADITEELVSLNVGNQGTNFTATKEQYECIEDIVNSSYSDAYTKIKKQLAKDKMEVFLSILRNFVKENFLIESDPRISFNIRESKNRLVFLIGKRYTLCIQKIKNETVLSFISSNNYNGDENKGFKNNKGEIEAFWNYYDESQSKEMTDYINDGLTNELSRNHSCNYKSHSNSEFAKDILGEKNTINKKYWLYAPGENANMWDEFLQEGTMGLGWDNLGNLNEYTTKEDIATRLQQLSDSNSSKANDATANFDFKESISIGDVIIAKKGRSAYLGYGIVTSNYYYDESVSLYKHKRKVNWIKNGYWESEHSTALKTLTDITNIPYKPNPSILAPKAILDLINAPISNIMKQQPINQILYGPPGTGKTFKLKDQYFPMYTTKESSLSAEQHFKNVVSECSWWQVIAIALIQSGKSKVSDIANHNWVIQKAALSNSNTIRPTIWGQLQSHTVDECDFVNVKSKQQPFIFNKTHDSFWEILDEEVKERVPELYDMIDSVENFSPSSDKEIQRYVFTTFHQSYSYEDFIEGIKPIMIEGEVDGNVSYHIEDGVFKQLCKKAALDPENRYAIFIDEINRGNVSAIFGELITLIEQDKRKGATNAMSALLPYSKNQFSVPQNVDIYGTMNTADRSVEALDTALRRRFSFEEMLPKPELLKDKGENGSGKVGAIVLEDLLKTINERIEALVDRDHTIGHAFFMEVDSLDSLRNVFANKVIPLLQEYFYGDYAKMEMVIGTDFFDVKESSKIIFAVKPEDFESIGKTYHIKNLSDKLAIPDDVLETAFNNMITGAN